MNTNTGALKSMKSAVGQVLGFLFPSEESVRKFEAAPAEELVKILPASEPIQTVNKVRIQANALFAYSDEGVKNLVWEIKYYRNEKIADVVGELIAERIKKVLIQIYGERGFSVEQFFLVPIPLTNRRLRERGFNHTVMLAQSILKYLPENFELAGSFFEKIRHTPKQSSIEDRIQRFENIVGAFRVPNPESVIGKNIIIIDDVITTGATVAEAKNVLENAGVRNVQIFAIAH